MCVAKTIGERWRVKNIAASCCSRAGKTDVSRWNSSIDFLRGRDFKTTPSRRFTTAAGMPRRAVGTPVNPADPTVSRFKPTGLPRNAFCFPGTSSPGGVICRPRPGLQGNLLRCSNLSTVKGTNSSRCAKGRAATRGVCDHRHSSAAWTREQGLGDFPRRRGVRVHARWGPTASRRTTKCSLGLRNGRGLFAGGGVVLPSDQGVNDILQSWGLFEQRSGLHKSSTAVAPNDC